MNLGNLPSQLGLEVYSLTFSSFTEVFDVVYPDFVCSTCVQLSLNHFQGFLDLTPPSATLDTEGWGLCNKTIFSVPELCKWRLIS